MLINGEGIIRQFLNKRKTCRGGIHSKFLPESDGSFHRQSQSEFIFDRTRLRMSVGFKKYIIIMKYSEDFEFI